MISKLPTGQLRNSELSAVVHEGITAKASNGQPAIFAIIDEEGNVLDSGAAVALEAWNVMLNSWKNFLQGQGHLRVHSKPPTLESKNVQHKYAA